MQERAKQEATNMGHVKRDSKPVIAFDLLLLMRANKEPSATIELISSIPIEEMQGMMDMFHQCLTKNDKTKDMTDNEYIALMETFAIIYKAQKDK